jgi:hypothetical protein
MSIFFSIIWNEILHPVPTRRPKKRGEKEHSSLRSPGSSQMKLNHAASRE